ncbi:hypothetical protein KP509_29G002600 [Ceratopteris richardii]|uniref:Alliinase C-terminal domain-containing protein n=1 Tax=Ceratopteris richardii TaxID=49495 RepID=A0A8T2R5Y5_CERRI|nr:hypothetical protein KP509_29G002600 [Ceratopteris richardii]KAH7291149.1 hypothetical protein KP509_29G002600 [Ceratopteris richardii]
MFMQMQKKKRVALGMCFIFLVGPFSKSMLTFIILCSGDPLMYLPYWRQNHETSSILIPGWYRIGYELSQPLIPVLEKEIRDLHKLVGNAVTDGCYILVGSGEMQLMMAAYSTISMEADGLPVHTVIDPPYYDAYERQVKTIKPGTVRWGAPGLDSESSGNWIPLEIVISPNNPDGSLRTPTWKHRNENARTVHDNAYYWPHYTPITGPRDDDFMLFSLSKVTGHAGSRLGWAIIKDRAVYEKMLMSVRLNSVTVSHEAQFRAAHILRSIREGYSKVKSVGLNSSPTEYAAQQLLFHYGHAKMKTRWEQMLKLFQASDRFLIEQNLEQSYCNFFKDIVHPLPAFVWIRCQREEDQSCFEIFRDAGIHGRGGANCGMTNRYVRLAMMDGDHTFKHLLNRLQALVST